MTLRDALWKAQAGCCWICREAMVDGGKYPPHHTKRASIDHVWPKGIYGDLGDFGVALLAHRGCNQERGARTPSERDVRTLVRTYQRLDQSTLYRFLKEARREAARARQCEHRVEMIREFLRGAA